MQCSSNPITDEFAVMGAPRPGNIRRDFGLRA
jgi:hypothetical protein